MMAGQLMYSTFTCCACCGLKSPDEKRMIFISYWKSSALIRDWVTGHLLLVDSMRPRVTRHRSPDVQIITRRISSILGKSTESWVNPEWQMLLSQQFQSISHVHNSTSTTIYCTYGCAIYIFRPLINDPCWPPNIRHSLFVCRLCNTFSIPVTIS